MQDLSICIAVKDENHEIIRQIHKEFESLGAEVIIVDDGSQDSYPEAIKHGISFGYGGALMTAIKNTSRPLVLTLDGDGQHTVSEAVKLYHVFKIIGDADMVVGVRRLKGEPIHRYMGRKFLNWTASLLCAYWLPDLNSGCRIFKRSVAMGYFPILCKSFSFTTSLTISMLSDHYRVEFFPINIENRKFGKTKVKVLKDGIITLFYILRNSFALRTRKLRAWKRNLFSQ